MLFELVLEPCFGLNLCIVFYGPSDICLYIWQNI